MHRDGLLWSYRDENGRKIDAIPFEIATTLRRCVAKQELQRVNYFRILHHDFIRLTDLRDILVSRSMDRHGNKEELIERIVNSEIQPSQVLSSLDRQRLSDMCRHVRLKSSGSKANLVKRLIEFYDDLTFEERTTKDQREEWFNNYELLAARAYSDLRAAGERSDVEDPPGSLRFLLLAGPRA